MFLSLSLCEPKATAKTTEPSLLEFSQNLYFRMEQIDAQKLFLKFSKTNSRHGKNSQFHPYVVSSLPISEGLIWKLVLEVHVWHKRFMGWGWAVFDLKGVFPIRFKNHHLYFYTLLRTILRTFRPHYYLL